MAAFLTAGIVPFTVIGIISVMNSGSALSNMAFAQLESVRELKRTQIRNFLAERKANMRVLMETTATLRQAAFEKLRIVQEIKKAQMEEYFRKCQSDINIISKNAVVEKALESFASLIDENGNIDEDMFTFTEEFNFKGSLRQFKEEYGYYDILVITKEGNVVYTLNRESDLGQNVLTGELRESGLGRCFQKGLKGMVTEDFTPYPPSGQFVCFMAAPILKYEKLAGVVVLKLNKEAVNAIVQRRKGMGETGETWLVGRSHGKTGYRSDRLIGKGKSGESKTDDHVDKSLSGKSGSGVRTGSAGKMEIIRYDPLEIPGLNWAMITTMGLEEVITPRLEGEDEDYFTKYVRQYGYDDLLLIHPEGEVFYSVRHEADYGTNIVSGRYADSGLGRVIRDVSETKAFGFADFQPYAPSDGKPAAFIAQPVISNGEVDLVVALRLSLDTINSVMQERSGMGETGETYLVGPDRLMRSDSCSDAANYSVNASFADPENRSIDTEASRAALDKNAGRNIMTNYTGAQVLSAYTPLDVWGTTYALITEIDEAEALAPVRTVKRQMAAVAIISIAAIIGAAILLTRYIVRPVNRVISGLVEIAGRVASGSTQISSASQSLSEGSCDQAASLEESSASLEEVSSMSRRNAENAENADKFMGEVSQAVAQADDTMSAMTGAMEKISEAARETHKIIKMIDGVTFQTNILALNATIEAARAGEAGLGFAVVAEEVRNLAVRTADATKHTADLIDRIIKQVSDGAEFAIRTDAAFKEVAAVSAGAAERINEIAAVSKEQAMSVEQVNSGVAETDRVTQRNAAHAQELAAVSEEMNAYSGTMKGFVGELAALVG